MQRLSKPKFKIGATARKSNENVVFFDIFVKVHMYRPVKNVYIYIYISVCIDINICMHTYMFAPQAGVPHIPHGRSAQYYTMLVQNKQLPAKGKASHGPFEMDADVFVKRPRAKALQAGPKKKRRRNRRGDTGMVKLSVITETEHPQVDNLGDLRDAAAIIDEMEGQEEEEFCVGSVREESRNNRLSNR